MGVWVGGSPPDSGGTNEVGFLTRHSSKVKPGFRRTHGYDPIPGFVLTNAGRISVQVLSPDLTVFIRIGNPYVRSMNKKSGKILREETAGKQLLTDHEVPCRKQKNRKNECEKR